MLNFGMPTLIETKTIDECAALCHELGLSFIELNMNLPQYQLNNIDIAHFKEIAGKYGISYTIHLDENLNFGDFNPYVADAYRRTVSETVDLAKKLGVSVLNMHLPRGVYFTLSDGKVYLFAEYKNEYLNSVLAFRRMCEKAVGDSDIKICIENCDEFLGFQKEALGIFLDSHAFGLTFDIGHDHGCGGVNEPYIIENKDRLFHMHIHDALGRKNHLALGTGEIDICSYIDLAKKQNCRMVLETKTIKALKQSVNWIKENNIE